MFRSTIAFGLALALLAACGRAPSGPPPSQTAAGACALISDPNALFGQGVQANAASDLEGAVGSCSWASADGTRSGDLIHYSAQSLGATTLNAQAATLTRRWTDVGVSAQALAGVGDAAQIATGLPGDSAQAVVRKGQNLFAIVANSGDPSLSSEELARRMATQAAAH